MNEIGLYVYLQHSLSLRFPNFYNVAPQEERNASSEISEWNEHSFLRNEVECNKEMNESMARATRKEFHSLAANWNYFIAGQQAPRKANC